MAQIVLSGDELIAILQANGLIPEPVTDVEADGEEIKLKVKTPWPVIKSLRVEVRFVAFDGGQIVLQLVTNRLIDTFEWLVEKMLESFPLADYGGRWEYPRLYIDVNRLIQEQLQGVQVDDMVFRDGHFHITTTHLSPTSESAEAQPDTDEDTSPGLTL